MTKALPNHAVLATQALIFCYADSEHIADYFIIPRGMSSCDIRHKNGAIITINENDTLALSATRICDFIHLTKIGMK